MLNKILWSYVVNTIDILRDLCLNTKLGTLLSSQEMLQSKYLEESKEFLQAYREISQQDVISWDASKHLIDHFSEELGDLFIMIMLKAIKGSPLRVDVSWEPSDSWRLYTMSNAYLLQYLRKHKINDQNMIEKIKVITPASFAYSVLKARIRHSFIGE